VKVSIAALNDLVFDLADRHYVKFQ